jgi:hypothetical protein
MAVQEDPSHINTAITLTSRFLTGRDQGATTSSVTKRGLDAHVSKKRYPATEELEEVSVQISRSVVRKSCSTAATTPEEQLEEDHVTFPIPQDKTPV